MYIGDMASLYTGKEDRTCCVLKIWCNVVLLIEFYQAISLRFSTHSQVTNLLCDLRKILLLLWFLPTHQQ